jgi:NAD(P)H-hydrate epimerase
LKIASVAQMREIDRRAQTEFGLTADCLMLNAGQEIARTVIEQFGPASACVVCGKGNNAGDGFVAARELAANTVSVEVVCLTPPDQLRGPAHNAFQRMQEARIAVLGPEHLHQALHKADVVIDAVLGTGIRGPAEGTFAQAIQEMNAAKRPIVAVDVPSGLRENHPVDEDSPIVAATLTVTIGLPKWLLMTMPGLARAGKLITRHINFPSELLKDENIALNIALTEELAAWIPPRPLDANKGTFGSVGILAGSAQYAGAAIMAARAALRCGCGLAHIFTTSENNLAYKCSLPEAITHIVPSRSPHWIDSTSSDAILEASQKFQALMIGPGLGTTEDHANLVQRVVSDFKKPMVLDADALTCLSRNNGMRAVAGRTDCILTPHPGEMARLIGKSIAEVQANRVAIAQEFAREHQVLLLLKGVPTLIARPDGQVYVNAGANTALAKGGSGDVLSGAIASLIAQGIPPAKAAILAARLHLDAAEICARKHGERGVLASELADALPAAILPLLPG